LSDLGVLSIHLDGAPCGVGCPFCYLGTREESAPRDVLVALRARPTAFVDVGDALVRAATSLPYTELAVAVSAPVTDGTLRVLARLASAARDRGRRVAITTTADVVDAHRELLAHADRLSLSVDAWKLDADAIVARVSATAARAKAAAPGRLEVVALATLSTPAFAQRLVGGLLAELVDLPALDAVALGALKPPPPFCDRAFWLQALAALAPLLDRALDRRLFLDCSVAARLLQLGGCPARPDLSPTTDGRVAFRSCVYAARADVVIDGTDDELAAIARDFTAPAACPFETRLGS
jgi:hypothetical protein